MMKMYRKNGPRRGRGTFVGITLLLVVILFQSLIPGILPNFFYQVATPIIRGWGSVTDSLGLFLVNFDSKQRLASENELLTQELADAREKSFAFDALQSDFASLTASHGRTEDVKGVLAAVLLAPPLSPYDTLILDVGAKTGVEVGSMVRSTSGLPLGKVTEVFRDFSRAELLSSPGVETAVRIGKDGVQARAIGIGDGEFQLLLPRELKVAKGDVVIFPELSPSPLGVIGSIDFQETDFLQLVSFRSPVNIRMMSHVLVERPSEVSSKPNAKQVTP